MLLPNMTARAQIQISKKKNVLVLPKIAVYRNKNKSFVYASKYGWKTSMERSQSWRWKRIPRLLILEGLKEKDSVIIGVEKK